MPVIIEASRSDLTVRIGRLDLYARRDRIGTGYWCALIRGGAAVELIVGNAVVTVSWGLMGDAPEVPIFALRRALPAQPERQHIPAE